MNFNISKYCCLQLTEAKIHRIYHLSNVPLSILNNHKYLGVTLQSNLKWNKHVVYSADSILGLLRRNIKVTSTHTNDLAYKALIRPKLEFASVVWSLWQKFLVDNLERIQRRLARYVFNDYHLDSSVSVMIDNLDWDSLEHRHKKASPHTFFIRCLIIFQ